MTDREESLETKEKKLYEEVWKDPDYRRVSPGEKQVDHFLSVLPVGKWDTIIDVGCGTGRAAKKLKDRGYDVLGIDFAYNALEEDIPFEIINIMEPPMLFADWLFCCDVLEHIPEERIDKAMEWLKGAYTHGIYAQIAQFPETRYHTEEPLHKCVHSAAWWVVLFNKYFKDQEVKYEDDGRRVVIWVKDKELE